MIEARALKNRLGSNTISKVLGVYRSFLVDDKKDFFKSIVADSLISQPKIDNFVSMVEQMVE